jgi:hypothetical protein
MILSAMRDDAYSVSEATKAIIVVIWTACAWVCQILRSGTLTISSPPQLALVDIPQEKDLPGHPKLTTHLTGIVTTQYIDTIYLCNNTINTVL